MLPLGIDKGTRPPVVTPEEAVADISSGERVYVHGVACVPFHLTDAMVARADLRNVEVVHMHTHGRAKWADPSMEGRFITNNLFIGKNMRAAVQEGRADYIPCYLSEVPALFRKRLLPIDTALLQVSPPDKHGFCSLGVEVGVTLSAVQMARKRVAQINPKMPRTHGDGIIHISLFDKVVEADEEIGIMEVTGLSEVEKTIGDNVAQLVDNGACLQMGIGKIPDATLSFLHDRKNLGIHTEMFSNGLVELYNSGAITNNMKKVLPGVIVTAFALGDRELYDFMDDNPTVRLLDVAVVNDPNMISKNPRTTSINSAIEIDLTGQVCADSVGTRLMSGVGGQVDFVRGASHSHEGKPIIALPSTTKTGASRIVAALKAGAGIVTPRSDLHYVVTEYGSVNMQGLNMRQRAKAMINLAHPDHRELLAREACEQYGMKYLHTCAGEMVFE